MLWFSVSFCTVTIKQAAPDAPSAALLCEGNELMEVIYMNHCRAPLNAELSVNTMSLFSAFQDSYF